MRLGSTSEPPRECDAVVIGAGIVGLASARELLVRHPGARLCVLEAEPGIAAHQTGHSSGVVHAGIYYRPGSLKARLCVEGALLLRDYCAERNLGFEPSGKLIVATEPGELPRLAELERRGQANGVAGLRRLRSDQIREVEPHAVGLAALHSPATAVVDFGSVAAALAGDVLAAGGAIHLGTRVGRITARAGAALVDHSRGSTRAAVVIACAGLWADRLAIAAGAPEDPRIVPFRGAYLRLRPDRAYLVRANLYPVPDPELPFLGAHLTRLLDGTVLAGPSALLAPARDAYRLRRVRPRELAAALAWPGTRRLARRHWRAALAEGRRAASRRAFAAAAARLVPELGPADLLPGPAGIRAQALGRDGQLVDDFVLHRTECAVHVRNAPSPAATASLALAKVVADEAETDLR